MNSTSRELADTIITLDGSINKNFQKLGYIYFALKSLKNNLPENNELNDKLLFLKSYLYRNIISYKQYNLSYDLVKLSKRKIPEQDEVTQYLKSYVSGVTDALNLIALPSLKTKSSYALNLKNDSDEKVQQIANFIKAIPDFYKITDIKKQMSLFVGNFQSLTIKIDDDKEQTIQNDLSALKSEFADIKSLINDITSTMQINNNRDSNKNSNVNKIYCRNKIEIVSILEKMKGTLIGFKNNENLNVLVNEHFFTDNEADSINIHYDKTNKIKWIGRERHLIRFVYWLVCNKIINNPQAYQFNLLIEQHFYNELKKVDFTSKQILTQSYNMMKSSNDELNELFNKYK